MSRTLAGRVLAREALWLSLGMLRKPSLTLWRLKYESRGRMSAAVAIVALAILMRIAWVYCTGFAFRSVAYRQTEYVRILDEAWTYLIVWITWTFANWGVATLADGEGTLRDVAIASAHAFMPLIALTMPLIVLSNLLTRQEAGIYQLVSWGSLVWPIYLLFVHVRTTHDYSPGKAIRIMALTIAGMVLLWALTLLLYLMAGQIVVFVRNIIQEVILRGF